MGLYGLHATPYPCPSCGRPTTGTPTGGGHRWAICELCFERVEIEAQADDQVEDDDGPYELRCRVCGCTDADGCEPSCYWVQDDLCSQCAGEEG